MKKFIYNVREQPHHVRHIYMWVSVVIVGTIIGTIWFSTSRRYVLAVVRPSTSMSDEYYAQKERYRGRGIQGNLAQISDSFGGVFEDIGKLFGRSANTRNSNPANQGSVWYGTEPAPAVDPGRLPVAN